MSWVVPTPRMPVANEGSGCDPVHIIIRVVTVAGQLDNAKYVQIHGWISMPLRRRKKQLTNERDEKKGPPVFV